MRRSAPRASRGGRSALGRGALPGLVQALSLAQVDGLGVDSNAEVERERRSPRRAACGPVAADAGGSLLDAAVIPATAAAHDECEGGDDEGRSLAGGHA